MVVGLIVCTESRCTIGVKSRQLEFARLVGLSGSNEGDAIGYGLARRAYYSPVRKGRQRGPGCEGDSIPLPQHGTGSQAIGLTECEYPTLIGSDGVCRYIPALNRVRLRDE